MMKITQGPFKVTAILLVLTWFSACRSAQHQPSALSLLKKVQSTYRGMRTFSAEANMVTEMNGSGMQQKMKMTAAITADSSGKYRMKSTGETAMLQIFDGQVGWLYMPRYKKYQRFSFKGIRPASQASKESGITIPAGFAGALRYGIIAKKVQHAHVLRSQTLHVDGALVRCWVVSVTYEPESNRENVRPGTGYPAVITRTRTVWVKKTGYLVYRDELNIKISQSGAATPEISKTSTEFSAITLNKPVPDSTFTFSPPPGATDMHLSGLMPNSWTRK